MQFLHGARDLASEVLGLLCLAQLLGMAVAPREKRQYMLGIVLLVLIAISLLYDLVLAPGYLLYIHAAGARANWPNVIINAVAVCAVFFLAYDYAMGSQSRAFFGFAARK